MLRVDEKSGAGAIRASQRMTAAGLHAAARIRACGVAAVLIAVSLFGMPASAQAPSPPAPHAATIPAAPTAKNAKRPVVSPYARAAARQARAGQTATAHAPTMVQGMGKPRKPHPGTPPK